MARCSCSGGATCSCVLEPGAGITIDGSGSSGDPFVINATGDLSGSFQANDTATVDMSLTGTGSAADPFHLFAVATVSMLDLIDVNDPAPPAEGEVPVWTTDHWEFKIPANAPPGTVNVGAGIIGDGSSPNPIKAAVSGVWGSGSLAGYPADTTLGWPIYTDVNGQLRTGPLPLRVHRQDPVLTYAAGFAQGTGGDDNYWAQWGPLVFYRITYKRTGADIAGPSHGNISNVAVAAAMRANLPQTLSNSPLGHGAFGEYAGHYIEGGTNLLKIGTVQPTRGIQNGAEFTAAGWTIARSGIIIDPAP